MEITIKSESSEETAQLLEILKPVIEREWTAVTIPHMSEEVEQYRKRLAAKTKAAMDLKKSQFKSFTGPIYGWDKDENDNLTPNWQEQMVIDWMKNMYYNAKKSANEIAKLLNADKIMGKRGGKWSSNSVSRTIKNPFHDEREKFEKGSE